MAYIETRTSQRTGQKSYKVVWRENTRKRSKTFHDLNKAEAWQSIIEAAGNDTEKAKRAVLQKVSNSPSLAEVAEQHITRLSDVEPATRAKYRSMFKNYLADSLGAVPVDMITEDDIAEWVNDLREDNKSPKTIRNVHGLLNSVMLTAVKRKHRPDNPCAETRLPKANRTTENITFLTHDEFRLLLDQVPIHFHPFVIFMVSTGLRFSEATALTPADFTDDRGEYSVSVQKAWKYQGDGTRKIGTPKSEKSRRTVGLGKIATEAVAPLVRTTALDDFVFKMARGGVMTSQAFYNHVWRDAVAAARAKGLRKKPRVHDLRHTYASWTLAEGESIENISYLLGHESLQTTRNVYTHVMPSVVRSSARSSDRALGSALGLTDAKELTSPDDDVVDAVVAD
ncbi:MAG TPA: tyrosine-type recombinase/integrase [Enteractinococcus sp.]